MGALGVNPPDIAPHATQEIPAMVAMIERLIETGNAYEAEGHVLFSVPSDPDYGALSKRDRDAMVAGRARRGRALQARSRRLRAVEAERARA